MSVCSVVSDGGVETTPASKVRPQGSPDERTPVRRPTSVHTKSIVPVMISRNTPARAKRSLPAVTDVAVVATVGPEAPLLVGDIVAYEYSVSPRRWKWAIGSVVDITHPNNISRAYAGSPLAVLTVTDWAMSKNRAAHEANLAEYTGGPSYMNDGPSRAAAQTAAADAGAPAEEDGPNSGAESKKPVAESATKAPAPLVAGNQIAKEEELLQQAWDALATTTQEEWAEVVAQSSVQVPVVTRLAVTATLRLMGLLPLEKEANDEEEWKAATAALTDAEFANRLAHFSLFLRAERQEAPRRVRYVHQRVFSHPLFKLDNATAASVVTGRLFKWLFHQVHYYEWVVVYAEARQRHLRGQGSSNDGKDGAVRLFRFTERDGKPTRTVRAAVFCKLQPQCARGNTIRLTTAEVAAIRAATCRPREDGTEKKQKEEGAAHRDRSAMPPDQSLPQQNGQSVGAGMLGPSDPRSLILGGMIDIDDPPPVRALAALMDVLYEQRFSRLLIYRDELQERLEVITACGVGRVSLAELAEDKAARADAEASVEALQSELFRHQRKLLEREELAARQELRKLNRNELLEILAGFLQEVNDMRLLASSHRYAEEVEQLRYRLRQKQDQQLHAADALHNSLNEMVEYPKDPTESLKKLASDVEGAVETLQRDASQPSTLQLTPLPNSLKEDMRQKFRGATPHTSKAPTPMDGSIAEVQKMEEVPSTGSTPYNKGGASAISDLPTAQPESSSTLKPGVPSVDGPLLDAQQLLSAASPSYNSDARAAELERQEREITKLTTLLEEERLRRAAAEDRVGELEKQLSTARNRHTAPVKNGLSPEALAQIEDSAKKAMSIEERVRTCLEENASAQLGVIEVLDRHLELMEESIRTASLESSGEDVKRGLVEAHATLLKEQRNALQQILDEGLQQTVVLEELTQCLKEITVAAQRKPGKGK